MSLWGKFPFVITRRPKISQLLRGQLHSAQRTGTLSKGDCAANLELELFQGLCGACHFMSPKSLGLISLNFTGTMGYGFSDLVI